MEPFLYHRATSIDQAVALARSDSGREVPAVEAAAQFIAGGTNMSDYMRLNVMQPEVLVDLNQLPTARYGQIQADERGLRLGCLVRMGEAEDHPAIRKDYPVIFDTLHLAASRQIRNMASLGGNVLQRTRCEYFRETSWPCNKRNPGSGCAALDGFNRQHAVLGVSPHCIAAYAGDFAQALMALDATLETQGPRGRRTIKFADLHRLPDDTPNVETVLDPGEVITFIDVPAGPWTRRSLYVKVRDRTSYQFALTGAAVALDLDEDDVVDDVRIALGGVAAVPWRASAAEDLLKGKKLDEDAAREAAGAAFSGALPQKHNAFKIPVGQETIVRALLQAKEMQV